MRIMAIGTCHLMFWNRVVGKLGKFHLGLRMTAGTEFLLLMATDFLLGALVQLVTIKAADVIERMYAGVPAGQNWCGCCRVAS